MLHIFVFHEFIARKMMKNYTKKVKIYSNLDERRKKKYSNHSSGSYSEHTQTGKMFAPLFLQQSELSKTLVRCIAEIILSK